MKLTAHLGKISWSLADKVLYVGFGLVQFVQIAVLPAEVYGVFTLLVALNTWILIVSDGSALAGIIQYGVDPAERRRVNLMALVIHAVVVAFAALGIYIMREPLIDVFHVKQFDVVATLLPLYLLLSVPRMFCLKIIYREMRMKDLFVADSIWFGVRTILTFWFIAHDQLHTLNDIVLIDFAGMAASSLATMALTRKDLVFGWSGTITYGTYLRYGIPLAMATALNSAPRQLDVYVIAAFFGVGVVGVYNPAKNLYRFFEQAFDAVTTLLYPAAVRMYAQHRYEDLQVVITKAISVTLIPTIIIVIAIELGLSKLIIPILGQKYAATVDHFNVLSIAALGMPFILMSSVIAAMGRSTIIVRYSAIGLLVSGGVLFVVGQLGQPLLVGLGLVTNTIVVGLLCTMHVRSELHFPLRSLGRAFTDLRNAIASRGVRQ